MFQSLIGTLQTRDKHRNIAKTYRFQSLIGTLQTLFISYPPPKLKVVSIPYRYATNSFREVFYRVVCIKVSIPYRYATNILFRASNLGIAYVSIPYRYATNREYPFQITVWTKVSIPYRYATNLELLLKLGDFLLFQSLIGTLQTG